MNPEQFELTIGWLYPILMSTYIATYSHGPLLPKNPFLADWLVQTALSQKYQPVAIAPLDDSLATQARIAMFKRLRISTRATAQPR